MNDTQTQETQKKLATLYGMALNYGRELPEQLASLWLDLLAPYTADQVAQAVARVVREYEYKTMPPFAVLQKALDGQTGTSPEAVRDMAAAEWAWLLKAIPEHGSYREPQMHPTTAHVLRLMGGWEAACQWPVASYDFKRKDFLDLWRQSHGQLEALELGADGVLSAITGQLATLKAAPAAIEAREVRQ